MPDPALHPRDIAALLDLIAARSSVSFGWAKGRCCMSFAAAAAEAQTGIDVLEGLDWCNRREALAVIKGLGGFETGLDARFDRISPALAQRGDLAGIADRLLGVQLAVVEGATLVAPGDGGLVRVSRAAMITAWSAVTARVPEHILNALAQANCEQKQ